MRTSGKEEKGGSEALAEKREEGKRMKAKSSKMRKKS